MRFSPGPGVGGHCIPVDPYYLAWRAREFDFVDRFVETAADINLSMPRHVVNLAAAALNDRSLPLRGSRVGHRRGGLQAHVGDARNAPASEIMKLLAERGCEVAYHDPHVATFTDQGGRLHASLDLAELVDGSDLIIIVTAHEAVDCDVVFERSTLIVDTVNRSSDRTLRSRQVLRLGAGWGASRSLQDAPTSQTESAGRASGTPELRNAEVATARGRAGDTLG